VSDGIKERRPMAFITRDLMGWFPIRTTLRFRVRNIVAAMVLVSLSAGMTRILSPSYIAAPLEQDTLLLRLQTPEAEATGKSALTFRDCEILLARCISPAVLQRALSDQRIARLAILRDAKNPTSTLEAMIQLRMITGPSDSIRVASLTAVCPTKEAALVINDAMGTAISFHGPLEVEVVGRTTTLTNGAIRCRWGPLDEPWKETAVWSVGALGAVLVLFFRIAGESPNNGNRNADAPEFTTALDYGSY
jgi:hypothetical protein